MADSASPAKGSHKRGGSRLGRRLLIGVFVAVFLLLVSEFSLRWTTGLGNPVLYELDNACGYLPIPNQSVRRFGCLNEINSHGMRSPPVQTPKPVGEYRLLFLGDSVTYGTTHVDQSQIFTSLLNASLPERIHRKVEVLNASVGGWAPGNEWGYLRSRGTFDADVVIFVINTADLTQPFADGGLSPASGYPDHRPLTAIGELWERYIAPRIFHRSTADSGTSAVTEVDSAKKEETQVLDDLAQACAFAESAGARFAIVYSPFVAPSFRTSECDREFHVFTSWAAKHHIRVLDLTAADGMAPVNEVFMDGLHLLPLGHKIAAEALLNWQPILPKPGP